MVPTSRYKKQQSFLQTTGVTPTKYANVSPHHHHKSATPPSGQPPWDYPDPLDPDPSRKRSLPPDILETPLGPFRKKFAYCDSGMEIDRWSGPYRGSFYDTRGICNAEIPLDRGNVRDRDVDYGGSAFDSRSTFVKESNPDIGSTFDKGIFRNRGSVHHGESHQDTEGTFGRESFRDRGPFQNIGSTFHGYNFRKGESIHDTGNTFDIESIRGRGSIDSREITFNGGIVHDRESICDTESTLNGGTTCIQDRENIDGADSTFNGGSIHDRIKSRDTGSTFSRENMNNRGDMYEKLITFDGREFHDRGNAHDNIQTAGNLRGRVAVCSPGTSGVGESADVSGISEERVNIYSVGNMREGVNIQASRNLRGNSSDGSNVHATGNSRCKGNIPATENLREKGIVCATRISGDNGGVFTERNLGDKPSIGAIVNSGDGSSIHTTGNSGDRGITHAAGNSGDKPSVHATGNLGGRGNIHAIGRSGDMRSVHVAGKLGGSMYATGHLRNKGRACSSGKTEDRNSIHIIPTLSDGVDVKNTDSSRENEDIHATWNSRRDVIVHGTGNSIREINFHVRSTNKSKYGEDVLAIGKSRDKICVHATGDSGYILNSFAPEHFNNRSNIQIAGNSKNEVTIHATEKSPTKVRIHASGNAKDRAFEEKRNGNHEDSQFIEPSRGLRKSPPEAEREANEGGTAERSRRTTKRATSYQSDDGPACAVCGDKPSGNFFNALVCLPCKSFFIRCTRDGELFIQKQCRGNCDVSKELRHRCQYCRFQRCILMGMTRKEKPEVVVAKAGQELCRVCGDLANGLHFGVYTCEGCKKFFRRGLQEHNNYVCRCDRSRSVNPRNRNHCRWCRYEKCITVGMSQGVKMGRPRKRDVRKAVGEIRRYRPVHARTPLHIGGNYQRNLHTAPRPPFSARLLDHQQPSQPANQRHHIRPLVQNTHHPPWNNKTRGKFAFNLADEDWRQPPVVENPVNFVPFESETVRKGTQAEILDDMSSFDRVKRRSNSSYHDRNCERLVGHQHANRVPFDAPLNESKALRATDTHVMTSSEIQSSGHLRDANRVPLSTTQKLVSSLEVNDQKIPDRHLSNKSLANKPLDLTGVLDNKSLGEQDCNVDQRNMKDSCKGLCASCISQNSKQRSTQDLMQNRHDQLPSDVSSEDFTIPHECIIGNQSPTRRHIDTNVCSRARVGCTRNEGLDLRFRTTNVSTLDYKLCSKCGKLYSNLNDGNCCQINMSPDTSPIARNNTPCTELTNNPNTSALAGNRDCPDPMGPLDLSLSPHHTHYVLCSDHRKNHSDEICTIEPYSFQNKHEQLAFKNNTFRGQQNHTNYNSNHIRSSHHPQLRLEALPATISVQTPSHFSLAGEQNTTLLKTSVAETDPCSCQMCSHSRPTPVVQKQHCINTPCIGNDTDSTRCSKTHHETQLDVGSNKVRNESNADTARAIENYSNIQNNSHAYKFACGNNTDSVKSNHNCNKTQVNACTNKYRGGHCTFSARESENIYRTQHKQCENNSCEENNTNSTKEGDTHHDTQSDTTANSPLEGNNTDSHRDTRPFIDLVRVLMDIGQADSDKIHDMVSCVIKMIDLVQRRKPDKPRMGGDLFPEERNYLA